MHDVYKRYLLIKNHQSAPPHLHHVDTSSTNPSNDTIISTLSKCPTQKKRNSGQTTGFVSSSDDEESKEFVQIHPKPEKTWPHHIVS